MDHAVGGLRKNANSPTPARGGAPRGGSWRQFPAPEVLVGRAGAGVRRGCAGPGARAAQACQQMLGVHRPKKLLGRRLLHMVSSAAWHPARPSVRGRGWGLRGLAARRIGRAAYAAPT